MTDHDRDVQAPPKLSPLRDEELVDLDKSELVYKSNRLIEGRYRLSAVAQKMCASVISRVDPTERIGTPLPTYRLTITEIAEMTGVKKQVLYRTITKYTKELKQIVILIDRADGRPGYRQLGLFREFEYDGVDGVLTVEFESRLEEHIRDFAGNFTKYYLGELTGLKSRYSIRLYELLRKSHNMSKSDNEISFYRQSLEDLRQMLGIEKNAYTLFSSFRRDVLNTAQKEIKEKTGLEFTFATLRTGRKVSTVIFRVENNKSHEPSLEGELQLKPVYDEGLYQMVAHLLPDVPHSELVAIITGYEKTMITEAVLAVFRAHNASEIKTNAYVYFKGILKKMAKEKPQGGGVGGGVVGEQLDVYQDLENYF